MDPARQFASPYVGMGNNPVVGVDPDGEWVKGAGLWNNLFKSDERIHSERMASNLSGLYGNYDAANIGGTWGLLREETVYSAEYSAEYNWMTFSPVDKDGQIGELDGFLIPYQYASGRADFDPLGQLSLGFFAGSTVNLIGRGITLMGRGINFLEAGGVGSGFTTTMAPLENTIIVYSRGSVLRAPVGWTSIVLWKKCL